MKYEYITVTGKNEIEVDERFYDILLAMDKEEYNSNRKHSRRHPLSLEGMDFEGEWFADGTDILGDLIKKENNEQLAWALSQLTADQQMLIQQVFFHHIAPSEIAWREGVDKSSVSHRLNRAQKRMKLFFTIDRQLLSLSRLNSEGTKNPPSERTK